MQRPRLKRPARHLWLADTAETDVSSDRPIANNRHPSATHALNQQRIAAVLRPFAADIQNDAPALTPVVVDAMNDDGLISRESFASGAANTTGKRLCRRLAMIRFCKGRERRTDQQQNNPGNCQSHEQFDQAETSLMHVISLRGVLRPAHSVRE